MHGWLATLLLAASPVALAAGLDFELSDGQQFVRLSDFPPKPTLINFWRTDCPPCVRELPELSRLAASGRARVITIAVQRPAETASAPQSVHDALKPPVVALHAPSDPSGLLARFGNRKGALPHSAVLDAERRLCATKTGEIDRAWLNQHISATLRCLHNTASQPHT